MPLFQEAIIRKHLNALDEAEIQSAFSEYRRVYSPEKIKNIKSANEEQYQEGFLKDVFGAVLGYSVYPESPFNIQTERKNETNAKKADGVILKDEKVVGVIELKDNKTRNLDSIKDQVFGYKNNHKECSYVISSNFHKLRFYIDDATEYEEFDLYNLDEATFKRFYLLLKKEGLLDKNLPKLLRQETKFHEEEVSKKLYRDYAGFKQRFFENAVKNNAAFDKLLLFKKSQKFLDRILFLLFAEDKGLVGTNSIVNIVEKWSSADDDYYRPLYEMVNTYFGHLYRGFTYQKTGVVVTQFGGELFAPDDVLDVLTIDDAVLKNDLLVLSKYDFNTDVDVNILGHIFEHSLNEVDDVEASLRGETPDKTKSKRKKDGVFYTPKYITKYIVDNTLGKLCTEKKAELKLDGDIAMFEYQKADGKLNEKGKELYKRLNAYKAWLLTVKVCDPACGSGAFLNQALSFFIDEHRFIDDLVAELTNTPLRLFDTDLQILENNIYGVDINEESVEIAKLSLWLRTAQRGRKLSDLSANIKCGNSLIDDPTVAGDKAFNWQEQFPTVFEKGGFDVVIGNPPYVDIKRMPNNQKTFFSKSYNQKLSFDLYSLFVEKSKLIGNSQGEIGFIIPRPFLYNSTFSFVRSIVFSNEFSELCIFDYEVFDGASVETVIIFYSNKPRGAAFKLTQNLNSTRCIEILSEYVHGSPIILGDSNTVNLIRSIESQGGSKQLNEIASITRGLEFGKSTLKRYSNRNGDMVEVYAGEAIGRYSYYDDYSFYVDRADVELYIKKLDSIYLKYPRILMRRVDSVPICTIVNGGEDFINNLNSIYNIAIRLSSSEDYSKELIIAILNSRLCRFYIKSKFNSDEKIFPYIRIEQINTVPIALPSFGLQVQFKNLVTRMLELNSDLHHVNKHFTGFIKSQIGTAKVHEKLKVFYSLDFVVFIREINKLAQKNRSVALSKKDEFEWMELFEENKKKVLELKAEIDKTDCEIDRMVYALYGLTEEEIEIVENA